MTLDSQQNCHKPISRSKCWYLLPSYSYIAFHTIKCIFMLWDRKGVFSQKKGGKNAKIFIEFILFLILRQITHRGWVWRFSCFPECRSSRCAYTIFPTLISGEKNCGTVVTTHFSAKGQKSLKANSRKSRNDRTCARVTASFVEKHTAMRLTWIKRPWTEPESGSSALPCGLLLSSGWNLFLVKCLGVAWGIILRESLITSLHVTARHFIKMRPAGTGISSDTRRFLKRDVLLFHI